MLEIIPKKTNKKAQSLIILFFTAAAALFFLTVLLKGIPLLWVFQLIAILLFALAVMLVARYVTKLFIYRIEPTDSAYGDTEGLDLTVTEANTSGKRRITVCRISLSGIKSVEVLKGEKCSLRDIKKREGRLPIYDYRPDLYPNESILIKTAEGGKEVYLCLAYDEALLKYLPIDKTDTTEDGQETL